MGFNLSWELDFWGRFRRAIESNQATLEASVEDYNDVLVTLLGDVATNYVQMRTLEGRIAFAEANVRLQQETLTITEARFKGGTTSELDVYQARSTLEQTQATIPEFEISLRQAVVQLCILLGMPPEDLRARLGPAPIPTAPPKWPSAFRPTCCGAARRSPRRAIGGRPRPKSASPRPTFIRPFRSTERSAIRPSILPTSSGPRLSTASVGPSFQWNILNYGRILNNVRLQDAKFQELVATYQQTVLNASQEVENGLVTFLCAEQRTQSPDGQRERR